MVGWAGPVEGGQETLPAVVREPRDWPAEKLADAAKTAAAAGRDDAVVLDGREPTRYTGEREPVDARPGHIPGARNVPVADHLDADGRLRDIDVLASRYGDVGALKANDVVAYCGSGVAACHNLLVLETLGVQGRLFPGSWSAWSADPARKVATGT
jgi:thiosulfate/3-mercaptopyruvate sulfurtransferase